MKDGKFHTTEDAVVIGIAKGETPKDAFKKLKMESLSITLAILQLYSI